MLERRQVWLEDQFLRQERDLLRLSRQINVLQDFITLHFDSFRDYCYDRDRSSRQPERVAQYPLYPPSRGPNDPVDSDELEPSSASPVDLSTTWRYNDQTQSPSPVLSRSTLSIPKDICNQDRLGDGDWDDSSNHSNERGMVSAPSQGMMNYGGTVNAYCSPVSPRLSQNSSPYDSVLGRILRSEPTHLKRELSPLVSTTQTTTTSDCPKLHWSCGTVTTTTTNLSIPKPIDSYSEELSDDNQYNQKPVGDELYTFASSLQVNLHQSNLPLVPSQTVKRPRKSKDPSQAKPKRKSPIPSTSKPKKSKKKTPTATSTSATDATLDEHVGSSNIHGEHPCSSGESCTNSNASGSGGKKCRFCGKTFQWSHSVKTHERLHTGDKPYVCKMCGTRFTQNGNLKVHAKTCVGKYAELYKSKNIWVCPLCTEMFQSMDQLMEHQRSHDRMQWSDKDKTCRYCNQVFQKRSLLLTHEMAEHQHIQDEKEREESTSLEHAEDNDNNQ